MPKCKGKVNTSVLIETENRFAKQFDQKCLVDHLSYFHCPINQTINEILVTFEFRNFVSIVTYIQTDPSVLKYGDDK